MPIYHSKSKNRERKMAARSTGLVSEADIVVNDAADQLAKEGASKSGSWRLGE